MKKPLRLFGRDHQQENVRFIHSGGVGYWFLYKQSRLVGERDTLREVSRKSQQQIWSRSWLIVEIVKDNFEELKEEFYRDNPAKMSEIEVAETRTNEQKLNLALEELVRNSLSDVDLLYHPVISKYRDQFTQVFLEDDSEYNNAVTLSCFKHRLIINDEIIQRVADDDEKGTILADDIFSGKAIIGETIKQEDIALLDETLINKVYQFCIGEFNNSEYKTTKDKEWDAVKQKQHDLVNSPVHAQQQLESDEKKQSTQLALTSSEI